MSAAPAFLEAYRSCFEDTWRDDTPGDEIRFVVLDSETTGLDPKKDRLITMLRLLVNTRSPAS